MIKVTTDGPAGPKYEEWLENMLTKRAEYLKNWRAGKRVKPDQRLWKNLKKIFLQDLFHGKCAFCEGKHTSGHPAHVEHFRPKLGVTEKRKKIDHSGYYWLVYEWNNLMLACANCNTWHSHDDEDGHEVTHPGKSEEFRVQGKRVREPDGDPDEWQCQLLHEKPFLLNPYVDDPAMHIGFDDAGFVHAKGECERAQETIDICDLNRLALVEARMSAKDAQLLTRLIRVVEKRESSYFDPKDEFSAWLNRCVRRILDQMEEDHGRTVVATRDAG